MIRVASRTMLAGVIVLATALPSMAVAPVPKVVPTVPANPLLPHDTYAGKAITLQGTSDVQGANITYDWDFGDGSAHATGTVTNMFIVEATHTYVGAVGTTWTAILTLTNTTTTESASANYPIVMRNNDLTSNVNVAIDEGLWFLHRAMVRNTCGVPLQPCGNWTNVSLGGSTQSAFGLTATNIQAFEVSGHLESGPASDPYTDDVARGLKYVFLNLSASAVSTHNVPIAAPPSCTVPPCALNPDGNGNGLGVFVNQGNPFYQGGMFIDAIVASGTPAAVTTTGPANVTGRTYKDIVQDMVDGYLHCLNYSNVGGSWRYSCNETTGDNSAAQWAAVGIIAAVRGFGVVVPPLALDWNEIWLNNSQNTTTGVFGYVGTGPLWGPYATTPSGLVQLSMDGDGRGDARWNKAESFIRDNFDNATTNSNNSMKQYFYGLFSFTKSMLLHSPGGVLTPITFLQTTSGSGKPPIDWYAAEVAKGDTSDGVARWLVSQQNPTPAGLAGSFWRNTNEVNSGQAQWAFSTGFAIIMLRRTVFISCVTDVQGRGTPANRGPARVDLTWTGIGGAEFYSVLRGTAAGGPYVAVGSTATNVYSDSVGLSSGGTYYYVLQPSTVAGGEICQSNEAKVIIPAGR